MEEKIQCTLLVSNIAYSCEYIGTKDRVPLDVKGNSQGKVTGVGIVKLCSGFPKVRVNQIYTKYNKPIHNSSEYVRKFIPKVNYGDIF